MITLITAVPGSGKTLCSIDLVLKAVRDKRMVFTNIDSLFKDKIDPSGLYLHDAPDDWRETPEGSLVIYDECQQPHLYPSNARPGIVGDERLTAMETHRHTGHDLVFITQAPTLVHHHIRKLVGEHIHLYRSSGVQAAMRYTWAHACNDPNDRGEQTRADSYLWTFPRSNYKLYKSATIHTHKFKMPKKMWFLIFLIALLSYFLVPSLVKNKGLATVGKTSSSSAQSLPHNTTPQVEGASSARPTGVGNNHIPVEISNINSRPVLPVRETVVTFNEVTHSPFFNYHLKISAFIETGSNKKNKYRNLAYFDISDSEGKTIRQTDKQLKQLGYKITFLNSCLALVDHQYEENPFYVHCEALPQQQQQQQNTMTQSIGSLKTDPVEA